MEKENKLKLNKNWEIPDDITFWDLSDIFERKDFWESLSNLILNSQNESLVVSINADWGEWKTDFLKRWNNHLKDKKWLNTIYFNSFKNDFIEDPFLALLWEILNHYEWEQTTYEKIKDKWTNILKWLIPLTWKIAWRFILWWDIEQVEDRMENWIEWEIAKEIWNNLKEYNEKENSIKIFIKTLEKIIKDKWQLVFIIDELDRCRPDFALRLLERIKHFFDIKWLYFVLWINKKQIEAYITKIYWNIDSATYLQKFIDIETILPKNIEIWWDIEKFINLKIHKEYKDIFYEKNDTNSLLNEKSDLIILFAEKFNLSFRQIEKMINYLVLFRKTLSGHKYYLNGIIIILIFLKVYSPEKYNDLKIWKLNSYELIEYLKINAENTYGENLIEYLEFFHYDKIDDELLDKFWEKLWYRNLYDLQSLDYRKTILKTHFEHLEIFKL